MAPINISLSDQMLQLLAEFHRRLSPIKCYYQLDILLEVVSDKIMFILMNCVTSEVVR